MPQGSNDGDCQQYLLAISVTVETGGRVSNNISARNNFLFIPFIAQRAIPFQLIL